MVTITAARPRPLARPATAPRHAARHRHAAPPPATTTAQQTAPARGRLLSSRPRRRLPLPALPRRRRSRAAREHHRRVTSAARFADAALDGARHHCGAVGAVRSASTRRSRPPRCEIAAIDGAASRFDRQLGALARSTPPGGRRCEISECALDALRLAIDAAELTGGAVDPTVGQTMQELGYDRDWDLLVHVRAGTPLHDDRGGRPAHRCARAAPVAMALDRAVGRPAGRPDPTDGQAGPGRDRQGTGRGSRRVRRRRRGGWRRAAVARR